jgi:hypothetical protein
LEHEQAGEKRGAYGEVVGSKFPKELTQQFGRGFGPAQIAVNVQ